MCRGGEGAPEGASGERPLARSVHDAGKNALTECDDEDQSGECADADPDPFLTGEARRLKLIEIAGQLMKVLLRELGDALIHLLLRETTGRERGGDLLVRDHVTHEREIGGA